MSGLGLGLYICKHIIEDDVSIREDFSELLSSEGYQLTQFANGLEGLEGLRKASRLPSLILLDLMMPVMNGYQFLQAIEGDKGFLAIPIMVLSADHAAANRLPQRPTLSFMKKPIDLLIFLDQVGTLLG